MLVKDSVYGECEVYVQLSRSIVDCYLLSGYSLTLDRTLTEEELNDIWAKAEDLQAELVGQLGLAWD